MRDGPLLGAQEGTRAERTRTRGPGSTPAVGLGQAVAGSAAAASLAALPGGAHALHGVEDLVVDDGAIGAAQGHLNGLCLRRGAAGALVLHVLLVDGVHRFAGTLTLQQGRGGRAL